MAKPNKNNKKQNDYFTTNIKQKGAGFIQTKSAQEIQRDAINIIRQIARGNIDLETNAQYFTDSTFISNVIIGINAKLAVETIIRDSVLMYYNSQIQNIAVYNTDLTSEILQNQMAKVEAYQCALYHITSFQNTQDVSWLYTLAAQLSKYRYII